MENVSETQDLPFKIEQEVKSILRNKPAGKKTEKVTKTTKPAPTPKQQPTMEYFEDPAVAYYHQEYPDTQEIPDINEEVHEEPKVTVKKPFMEFVAFLLCEYKPKMSQYGEFLYCGNGNGDFDPAFNVYDKETKKSTSRFSICVFKQHKGKSEFDSGTTIKIGLADVPGASVNITINPEHPENATKPVKAWNEGYSVSHGSIRKVSKKPLLAIHSMGFPGFMSGQQIRIEYLNTGRIQNGSIMYIVKIYIVPKQLSQL